MLLENIKNKTSMAITNSKEMTHSQMLPKRKKSSSILRNSCVKCILVLSLFLCQIAWTSSAHPTPKQEDVGSHCDPDSEEPTCPSELLSTQPMVVPQCSLYLAPSSIPGAGWGVFAGKDVSEGEAILHSGNLDIEQDLETWYPELLIPILETRKTIPYRGKQRFLSWLGYVWPEYRNAFYTSAEEAVFPDMEEEDVHYQTPLGLSHVEATPYFYYDDDKEEEVPINVFAPGLASMLNSHPNLANMKLEDEDQSILWNADSEDDDDDDDDEVSSPLDQARQAPYSKMSPGSAFVASRSIPAGSEIFMDYGTAWHAAYQAKQEELKEKKNAEMDWPSTEEFFIDRDEISDEEIVPSEKTRRMEGSSQMISNYPPDFKMNIIDTKRRQAVEERMKIKNDTAKTTTTTTTTTSIMDGGLPEQIAKQNGNYQDFLSSLSEQTQMTSRHLQQDEASSSYNKHSRDVSWLQQHAACLDHLQVGPSQIPNAGRGVFSRRFLSKGSTVATSPLLALKRSDLFLETNDEEEEEIAHELLLNYAYGHSESDLLLVPYAPAVNFINHATDAHAHAHAQSLKANVRIQWPDPKRAQDWIGSTPQEWFSQHPLEITRQSGRLFFEIVALRDIQPGEEIVMDYGSAWEQAWELHEPLQNVFRQEIGVPQDFFPNSWLHQTLEYEVDPMEDLQPGEIRPLVWKHNGQPVSKNMFVVGLPPNMTTTVLEFAEDRGIVNLFQQVLESPIMDSSEWFVMDMDQHLSEEEEKEQWFVQRYKSVEWDFNMHYIAAWNEEGRQAMFGALGKGGYDLALNSIGNYFGMDSLSCFHVSFMGVSEADKSFMHTDLHATDGKAFNIIFPMITVEGSSPELDIQSDNADVVVSVKYQHDRAFVLRDWAYHKTSAVTYEEKGQIRIVIGMYCAEMNESNSDIMRYLYSLELVPPFMDQFNPPIRDEDIHWDKTGKHTIIYPSKERRN